jgi:hypothetical protein
MRVPSKSNQRSARGDDPVARMSERPRISVPLSTHTMCPAASITVPARQTP